MENKINSTGEAGKRLLVVDDEMIIRRVMKRITASITENVVFAESGVEAVELLAKESFDLILLDVVMPGLSGLEVLKRIREEGNLTPVIMMTAYSSIQSADDARRLGANGYLPKPFNNIDEVRESISNVLQGSEI